VIGGVIDIGVLPENFIISIARMEGMEAMGDLQILYPSIITFMEYRMYNPSNNDRIRNRMWDMSWSIGDLLWEQLGIRQAGRTKTIVSPTLLSLGVARTMPDITYPNWRVLPSLHEILREVSR
jgi:hypothetical protein